MNLLSHLPQWAVDFWSVYSVQITPVLVTLLLALLTWVAIKLRSDAKINAAKTDAQIDFMKQVANKEDCKPEMTEVGVKIDEQANEIAELKRVVELQTEMFNLAFQNSNLDPEIKCNLDNLNNTIMYGSENNRIKELEEENIKLQDLVIGLKQELESQKTVAPVEEESNVRIRR